MYWRSIRLIQSTSMYRDMMSQSTTRNRQTRWLHCGMTSETSSGNVDAINAVLRHYERYIAALATRTLYDEVGVPHLCVDEEMKRRLKTKLITKILGFKLIRAA